MRGISVAALMLALGGTFAVCAAAQQAAPAAAGKHDAPPAPAEPAKLDSAGPVKPMALPASVDPNTYILGADDVLTVRVWREADLSGSRVVRPDGKITMPLINEVKAAGLTPIQLGEEITNALTKFVNSPQVEVSVEQVRSRRYFVDGEVGRPGAYPLATPTTVFEALSMAGGFREFANKKGITIIRGDKRLKFNWNEVIKGRNLSQNILLENGDHIVVQ